jgi:hypothetical protein
MAGASSLLDKDLWKQMFAILKENGELSLQVQEVLSAEQ